MTTISIKTGEKAPVSGIYKYDGNPEGKTVTCAPTPEERLIPLQKGEPAPPVRSCEQPARWTLVPITSKTEQ